MKSLHCPCGIKVAEIAKGSKIKKEAVMICPACEKRRKALELRYLGKSSDSVGSMFDEIFGRR